MGIAKVIVNGVTTMDVTQTTATADKILQGYGCIGADGEWIDGTATGGGSTPSLQSKTATPTTSQQTVTADTGYDGLSQVTVNPIPSQYIVPSGTKSITENGTGIDVASYASVNVAVPSSEPSLQYKVVSPSETAQHVLPDSGYDGLSQVDVDGISSNYVGSDIAKHTANDLVAAGATITTPAGYYAEDCSKSVALEMLTATPSSQQQVFTPGSTLVDYPATMLTHDEYYTIDTSGLVNGQSYLFEGYTQGTRQYSLQVPFSTVVVWNNGFTYATSDDGEITVENNQFKVSKGRVYWKFSIKSGAAGYSSVTVNAIPSQYIVPSGTKSITANGTGIDVAQYASVDVAVPTGSTTSLQSKSVSYTPSETTQSATVTADSGYDGLSSVDVSVGAISSTYVGSGITRRSDTDLWTSGRSVIVPAGYYSAQAQSSIAFGTEGTPTATKGSVSNHAVTVTPSVTNGAGYIAGGTKNGTAVTVSASELVSGTKAITGAGTTDVTEYASVSVASGGATASATKGTVSNHSVTVTPSVARTAGWVTAGSSNGTAVTVSASELVSGSQTITANGTTDVTNLASVTVDIDFITYHTSTSEPTSSQGSDGDIWLVTA